MIRSLTTNRDLYSTSLRAFLTALLFVSVSLSSSGLIKTAFAATGCPPTNGGVRWALAKTVYYDVSSLQEPMKSQVLRAIEKWNDANQRNGSGVEFKPSDASHPATLTVQNTPTTLTTGGPAEVETFPPGPGEINSAIIRIDGNNSSHYDPNVAGYDTAFEKAMLHELGHTMGLGHVPLPNDGSTICGGQTLGNSVMNGKCGVNDEYGNMATDVTDCDNSIVSSAVYPPPLVACDAYATEMCSMNLGWMNPFTCHCEGVWYYNNPDPYYGGGPCHDTYSCTPAYTGVLMEDGEGGYYWDMEFDSWACYYEGCY
jgi:hypothetical protein